MKKTLLAAVALLVQINQAEATDVIYQEQKLGKNYTTIPIYQSSAADSYDALQTLAEITIPPSALEAGDVVRVTARACATNNKSYNANWVVRVRIEPTPGDNWGDNIPPDRNDEQGNGAVHGFFGTKMGSNISPARHHDCRDFSTIWVANSDVANHPNWYAKLVTRAFNNNAVAGDVLGLDYSEIEVSVLRGSISIPRGDAGGLSYLDRASSTTDSNSYTFNSLSLGTEDPDRKIIVLVGGRTNSAGKDITQVTVGGVVANCFLSDINNSGGSDIAKMCSASVPTGTTGTVQVVANGTLLRAGVALYRKTGNATPLATFKTTSLGTKNNLYGILSTLDAGAALVFVTGRYDYNWGDRPVDFDTGNIEGGYGQSALRIMDTSAPNETIQVVQPDALGAPVLLMASF